MNRIATTMTAFSIAAGLTVAPTLAAPASADTPSCVSKPEFQKVEKGWSMARVHRVFDVDGKQAGYISGGAGYPAEQFREYKGCTAYSYIQVDYKKHSGVWKVAGKTAFW